MSSLKNISATKSSIEIVEDTKMEKWFEKLENKIGSEDAATALQFFSLTLTASVIAVSHINFI